jgi:CBS domain-containing protein
VSEEESEMNAVNQIMTTSPVTVRPRTALSDLLALFNRHDLNAFPVLDERERLVGIVSKLGPAPRRRG